MFQEKAIGKLLHLRIFIKSKTMHKKDVNTGTEVIFRPIDPSTGKRVEPIYTALTNDGYMSSDGEFRVNIAGVYGSVSLNDVEKRWK